MHFASSGNYLFLVLLNASSEEPMLLVSLTISRPHVKKMDKRTEILTFFKGKIPMMVM